MTKYQPYDIIGDIHGCGETLRALLEKLGYSEGESIYRHPERKVIFLGDFIDRGPHQKDVVNIVRGMMKSGDALAVMGNHEFNAIAYSIYHKEIDRHLRENNEKNYNQHKAFLEAYQNEESEYTEILQWFMTLPLWLELEGLNVVHACWDRSLIAMIREKHDGSNLLNRDLLINGSIRGNWEFEAIETLLKGKEIPLPEDCYFIDKEGTKRHEIRVRWWDQDARTYQSAYMGPESARTHIPDDEIEGDHLVEYDHNMPPVFLGHYWMEGEPEPLAPNIACLDYSVAKPGGKLVAYRWQGERAINRNNFTWVDRLEPASP
jgi:hypothetical protein